MIAWYKVLLIVPCKLLNQEITGKQVGADLKKNLHSPHDIINSGVVSALALLCLQHWSNLHLSIGFSEEISVIWGSQSLVSGCCQHPSASNAIWCSFLRESVAETANAVLQTLHLAQHFFVTAAIWRPSLCIHVNQWHGFSGKTADDWFLSC